MHISRIILASVLVSAVIAFTSNSVSPRAQHTFVQESVGDETPQAAQQVSNRCLTPYFWCVLPTYGPFGRSLLVRQP
jgi:hypothetical protein